MISVDLTSCIEQCCITLLCSLSATQKCEVLFFRSVVTMPTMVLAGTEVNLKTLP